MWDPDQTPGLGDGFAQGFVMGASCVLSLAVVVGILWILVF